MIIAADGSEFRGKDLTGRRFGRLTVVELARFRRAPSGGRIACWRVECDCGTTIEARVSNLISGTTQSCGCLRATHGHAVRGAESGAHKSWRYMMARCTNPNNINYPRYGGRGIEVRGGLDNFEAFYALLGDRPEGLTLDRIDNEGHYEPGNVRWATRSEQRRNQRPRGKYRVRYALPTKRRSRKKPAAAPRRRIVARRASQGS